MLFIKLFFFVQKLLVKTFQTKNWWKIGAAAVLNLVPIFRWKIFRNNLLQNHLMKMLPFQKVGTEVRKVTLPN